MAKHLSWKIDNNNYAYLYIPGKKTHITERIFDSTLLNKIMTKVSSWDESKYHMAFDEMNEEVFSKFGIKIPYDKSFFESEPQNNVVILGTSKEKFDKINEIKNELLDVIDQRFSDILNKINEQNDEIISLSNKRTVDVIKEQKILLNETLEKVNLIKQELEKKFNNAIKTLNKATKVIELDNLEINSESLKNLFEVVEKSNKWISDYSNDIEIIRQDYMDFRESLPIGDKQAGVFKGFNSKFARIDRNISSVPLELKRMDNVVEKIKREQNKKLSSLTENSNEAVLLGSKRNVNEISRGNFKVIVNDDKITMENMNNNTSVIIDNDGIKLNGDVFINGTKYKQ